MIEERALTKAPNDVDRHVGSRVRLRRMMVGMSQEKLGDALGVTFQQVQKYEKGTNRISVSRLQQIASALGVSIDFLYKGAAESEPVKTSAAPRVLDDHAADLVTVDGLKLLRAFHAIRDRRVRRRLLNLVSAVAGEESA